MATKQNPIALAKKVSAKVNKELNALKVANGKLAAFISVPTGLIGGAKMLQKLKKQYSLQSELAKVLDARLDIFEDFINKPVVEKK